MLLDLLQPPPEDDDAAVGDPAVGLELRLARPPRADTGADRTGTTAEALEVLPHSPHARQVVLELRQLDLELAFGAASMLGEDVEDQLGTVDDACFERVLEDALLGRVELAVHQQHVGSRGLVGSFQLLELPLADVTAWVGRAALLDKLIDGLDERSAGELAQLVQLRFGVRPFRQHSQDEPALGLGPGRRVGLARRHPSIMPCNGVN